MAPRSEVRTIALYLPQFHPIPENDAWWGKGFTEWTNTVRAKPLFRGHYQPHLPADLGFYDLRLPETRLAQAALARAHGIDAFCYYHYWFAGKRLLERPFSEVLASGQPSLPFCLAWANESWTGIWHGAPNRVLVEQTYPGVDDHRRHFETLLPAFLDRRYVRVDGKPLFYVYRPGRMPDEAAVWDFWRRLAQDAGLPGLFLVGESASETWDLTRLGYDTAAIVRLPPRRREHIPWREPIRKTVNAYQRLRGVPTIVDYRRFIDDVLTEPVDWTPSIPCIIPNWDNTPRANADGLVIAGSTPELFREQVRRALARFDHPHATHRLLFVKSWNEWAEGNHLEPDARFGRQYLEVLKEELARAHRRTT